MKNKNQNLYIAQFIATVCVVVVHSGTIVSDPALHFVVKSMVCRIAVPFFFINNAYFFRMNSKREGDSLKWLRKIVRLYAVIFILYIPFGIQLIQQTVHVHLGLLPIVFVTSFFYSGSFYHLWYFPALVFSIVMVRYMLQKLGYRWMLLICLLLFSIGSIETYSAFFSDPLLVLGVEKYFSVFATTRNGLFFSPIFVLIGFVLADNKYRLKKYSKSLFYGLILASLIGVFEGMIVFQNQGIDKNFMYFTIPFTVCLFGLLVISNNKISGFERLKPCSQSVFLLHMIPIQIFNFWHNEITVVNGLFRVMVGVVIPLIIVWGFGMVRKTVSRVRFAKIK
ncbi:transcriptional regulator [Enterococcus mundtii]|uniref:acyltransferase family protein n=1 Tax=Enterococcus mundtii TaxID=53346 RepID=UPI000D3C3C45|nr:acyltransferase [Enterococcus mundtii]PTO40547.1 transcriptional regulator [Enterococcus mundtii]PTO41459.1 transcriptional regulator [Enterococcus mundtii]